jgi:hypothetical protein
MRVALRVLTEAFSGVSNVVQKRHEGRGTALEIDANRVGDRCADYLNYFAISAP